MKVTHGEMTSIIDVPLWLIAALRIALLLLVIAAFAIVWVLCWLSFKWFFYPPMKDNLLLAFATLPGDADLVLRSHEMDASACADRVLELETGNLVPRAPRLPA